MVRSASTPRIFVVPSALAVFWVWTFRFGFGILVPGMNVLLSMKSKSICVPCRFMM